MPILSQPFFRNEPAALSKLEALVWPNGPVCPHCGTYGRVGEVVGKGARPGLKFCKVCRKQYRATMGTIFESSHVPVHKWFQACYLLTASDVGISAHQLHLRLGITMKTAQSVVARLAQITHRGAAVSAASAAAEEDWEAGDRFPRVRWRGRAERDRLRASSAAGANAEEANAEDEVPWAEPPRGETRQFLSFVKAAQELRCRDDETSFDRVLARIVRHPHQTLRRRKLLAPTPNASKERKLR